MAQPYRPCVLKHGYRIFGKMGDDQDFRGIILVRKDGGIRTVQTSRAEGRLSGDYRAGRDDDAAILLHTTASM